MWGKNLNTFSKLISSAVLSITKLDNNEGVSYINLLSTSLLLLYNLKTYLLAIELLRLTGSV